MDIKLEEAKEVLSELSALIQNKECNIKLLTAYQKIAKRLKVETQFLQRQAETPSSRTNKASSNLPYLYGVFNVVKQSDEVQQVICDWRKYKTIVDVICDGGRTWKKVIARDPQSLHLVWASDGQYGDKDAVKKVTKYLEAAKQESDFSPPKVVCVFTRGVTHEMAQHLEGVGVTVEGKRVAVSDDVIRRLQGIQISDDEDSCQESDEGSDCEYSDEDLPEGANPSMPNENSVQPELVTELTMLPPDQKIFLDVTSMVIYSSDVCNGGANFHFKDEMMAEQAKQERTTPVKQFITSYMENRKLITCEAALANFRSFLQLLGGQEEKLRAEELIGRLIIVPDVISKRFQLLKEGGKIKERSKIIFGTADQLRCNILTSNDAFVRAAAGQGVTVSAIIHQSRALSESKRLEESSATAK